MLVLARKVGQVIRIADEVEVKILEINRNKVRLGISAPCDVPVHREEIFRRLEHETSTNQEFVEDVTTTETVDWPLLAVH